MNRWGWVAWLGIWAASAQGAVVPIPGDYGGIEIPVGALVRLTSDTILPGASSEISLFKRTLPGQVSGDLTCRLYYTPDPQRRKLTAGTSLEVTSVYTNPTTQAPGSCWKDGAQRPARSLGLSLQTPGGFTADLICESKYRWLGSEKYEYYDDEGNLQTGTNFITCQHVDLPDVGELAPNLDLLADESLLTKVIGY